MSIDTSKLDFSKLDLGPTDPREVFQDAVQAVSDWRGKGPEPTVLYNEGLGSRSISIDAACDLVAGNRSDQMPHDTVVWINQGDGKHVYNYAGGARVLRAWVKQLRSQFT